MSSFARCGQIFKQQYRCACVCVCVWRRNIDDCFWLLAERFKVLQRIARHKAREPARLKPICPNPNTLLPRALINKWTKSGKSEAIYCASWKHTTTTFNLIRGNWFWWKMSQEGCDASGIIFKWENDPCDQTLRRESQWFSEFIIYLVGNQKLFNFLISVLLILGAFKDAIATFYIEIMWRMCKIGMTSSPQIFLCPICSGSSKITSSKFAEKTQAIFFNCESVKNFI